MPLHLRNAPTKLTEALGHGADYRYPHDFPGGFVPGVEYLPADLVQSRLYKPSDLGREVDIAARMRERGQIPKSE